MDEYPLPTINCLAFVAYSGARIVLDGFYVGGQPSDAVYPAIASARIASVVCVRQPGESVSSPPVPPPPPFHPDHEKAELAKVGVSFTDVPITRTMTQSEFDVAATQAALAILTSASKGPVMVHCSTGDRASSAFAAMLIALGMPNTDAVEFATNQLLLANSQVTALVQGYSPAPDALGPMREAAAASKITLPALG